MRRGRRDPVSSLELGVPVYMSRAVSIKRISLKTILKYIILIVLGVAIHSIYREIFQVKHENDDISLEKENDLQKETIKKPEAASGRSRILSDEELKDGVQKALDARAKKISHQLFEAANRRQQEEQQIREREKFQKQAEKMFEDLESKHQNQEDQMSDKEDVRIDIPTPALKVGVPAADGQNDGVKDGDKGDDGAIEKDIRREDTLEERRFVEEQLGLQSLADIAEETIQKAKLSDSTSKDTGVKEKEWLAKEKIKTLSAEGKMKLVEELLAKQAPIDFKEAIKKVDEVEKKIKALKGHSSNALPPFVTAIWKKNFEQTKQLIYSLQNFYPRYDIYVWNIDLSPAQREDLANMCSVTVKDFNFELFPSYFRRVESFYWIPIVLSMSTAEYEHITWINPTVHIISDILDKEYAERYIQHDIAVIGQEETHTTFAVTNPFMYKYLKVDKEKLYETKHIKIMAMIIHNTNEVRENFMDLLVACSMESDCLAPPAAKWDDCGFDVYGKKYASCHRYHESAINILLHNWFNYDKKQFLFPNLFFHTYETKHKSIARYCRGSKQKRDL